jgi:HEPN domain-containing protein
MRPPEDARKRIVSEWSRKADSDLAVAERLLSDEAVFSSAVAFHCQQAAEKYLKALLTHWSLEFPKTHVLAKLTGLIETRDPALAASLLDVDGLTPYGVDLRYPGDRPDASPTEAREAVRLAKRVRDAILPLLSQRSDPQR